EGEKTFDTTLRLPKHLRSDERRVLEVPAEVTGHQVKSPQASGQGPTAVTGASMGLSSVGSVLPWPAVTGSLFNVPNLPNVVPRCRLKDLVTPVEESAAGSPSGFLRPGASVIS